jgi:excisionase family DNA binding protein
MGDKQYLKTSDILGTGIVGRTKLYKLIHTGELKAYKIGERGYLFKPEDVEAALKLASGEQEW